MKRYYHYVYLLLAFIGLSAFFWVNRGIVQYGSFSISDFVRSTWTDNFYARSITLDFWIGALAGVIFMGYEGVRLKMKSTWLFIILSFVIAFAFAFPLFLFWRHRRITKLGKLKK